MEQMDKIRYRPLIYTGLAFAITWTCVLLLWALNGRPSVEYKEWWVLLTALDFLKSASPSIVSLVLLKNHISKKGFLVSLFSWKKNTVLLNTYWYYLFLQ